MPLLEIFFACMFLVGGALLVVDGFVSFPLGEEVEAAANSATNHAYVS